MKKAESIRSLAVPIAVGLLLPVGILAYSGCKKDEPPPPLPSAAPATTPSAPLVLAVEDATSPEDVAVDTGPDVRKVGGGSPASMKKCCQALAQNAENAPEPTKSYMKQLAAACLAAAGSGTGWSGGGFSCK